jgi:hypothetical protein
LAGETGKPAAARVASKVKMRRVLALVVPAVALVVMGIPAGPASACSCAPVDPVAGLDSFPAAFVGTFVGEVGAADVAPRFTFTVEQWVRGDYGEVITVQTPSELAGCGYEFPIGQRMASFLTVDNGELSGGLCTTIDPDILLRAAEPPVFDGTGPPALLVAGPFAAGTYAVLDGDGGLLTVFAQPPRDGPEFRDVPLSFHPCPGGRMLVERWGRQLLVRNLETLTPVRVDLTDFGEESGVGDVACRMGTGNSIWMVGFGSNGSRSLPTVYEAIPEPSPLFSLDDESGLIDIGPTVTVQPRRGENGDEVWLVRDNGEETLLHRIEDGDSSHEGVVSAAEGPGGGTVAVLDVRPRAAGVRPISTLTMYDTGGAELARRQIAAEADWLGWVDDDRLLLRYRGEQAATVDVVDATTLESISTLDGWRSANVVADGDLLYGLDYGHLMRADLRTGVVDELAVLNAPTYGPIALLPPNAAIPEPPPGTPQTAPPTTPTTAPAETTLPSTTTTSAALPPVADEEATVSPWLVGVLAVMAVAGVAILAGVAITRRR